MFMLGRSERIVEVLSYYENQLLDNCRIVQVVLRLCPDIQSFNAKNAAIFIFDGFVCDD